ncbi:MAG: hypothetical protein IKP86_03160 [Anaerolineaceae bacterium]|nr:hypothetical protein [Anaerolineaceae bacterium]
MNKKTMNTILTIAAALLGIAGLVLLLISIFSEHQTLLPGMLCVVLGTLCNLIRMQQQKIERH